MNSTQTEAECCPKFDPGPWDDKTFRWENKRFVRDRVFTLFHMPVNFGKVITRLMTKTAEAGIANPDYLCLSDHTTRFNMDIYLAVEKEVPGVENIMLTGNFYSRVYEGDFRETGKWCADFEKQMKAAGFSMKKMYMWYTTCPKCAKKYGKNYVVLVGAYES